MRVRSRRGDPGAGRFSTDAYSIAVNQLELCMVIIKLIHRINTKNAVLCRAGPCRCYLMLLCCRSRARRHTMSKQSGSVEHGPQFGLHPSRHVILRPVPRRVHLELGPARF